LPSPVILSLSLRPRFLWRSSAIMASTFIRGYCKVFPSCSNQKNHLAAVSPKSDQVFWLGG
jgi:hypothetical protein